MKKIFIVLLAAATLAACTKSEVQYEPTGEIGFQVVSGKMTKAAVEDEVYPTDLHMYVFAQTSDNTAGTADYLNNAEFAYNAEETQNTDNQIAGNGTKNLWAGWKDNEAFPYYWPNVKDLHFAGVSKSGNVNNGVVPSYAGGTITLDGYISSPGTATFGDNDLMWFPKTQQAYGKGTKYVPVEMKHACSWITIKLEGDNYTAGKYFVTDIHIEGLTTKGKAELGTTANWTLSTEAVYTNQQFDVFKFTPAEGADGAENATGTGLPEAGKATEAGFETVANNTIVLPNQVPGTLSITYNFKSQAGEKIEETVTGSLKFDGETKWAAGTHYTYTVKITATQILIAPTVEEWTPSPETGGHTVTVQ